MSDVSEDGTYTISEERPVQDVLKGYTYFARGDVLIAKITPCMENGKAAHVRDLPTDIGFGSTEFHVIRPTKRLDARYLFFLVWNPAFRQMAERHMTGSAGQKRVPTHFLMRVPVPLPSLREQRRIAAILDKADAIRRKRREVIALNEGLLRSAFLEMFGDPVTNPKAWPEKPLCHFGAIITGNTPSRKNLSNYGTHIEWIKTDNITGSDVYLTTASESLSAQGRAIGREVPAGAILMACIAGSLKSIGKVAISDRAVTFNQQINAIVPFAAKSTTPFLYTMLKLGQRRVQGISTGGMKDLVSKGRLSSLTMMMPPLEQQRRIDTVFARYVAVRQHCDDSAVQADDLFHSLVQRAFRGEL